MTVARVALSLLTLLSAVACQSPACRALRGSTYLSVEMFATRGCADSSDCGQRLRLEFDVDGTWMLDLDDTDVGGTYTCEDRVVDLHSEVFAAELSADGERLSLRGPDGTRDYARLP